MSTVTITKNSPPDLFASFASGLELIKRDGNSVTPSSVSSVILPSGNGLLLQESDIANLVTDPSFDSVSQSYSPGWDTAINGNLGLNNWSLYNGGVPSPSVGYHANVDPTGGVNGAYCLVFRDINSQYGQAHRWLGASQGLGTPSSLGWAVGDKITIGVLFKADNIDKAITIGIYHYNNPTSGNAFADAIATIYPTKVNEWEYATYTFTITSDWGLTSGCSLYIYGHYYRNGAEGTVWVDRAFVQKNGFPIFPSGESNAGRVEYTLDTPPQDFTVYFRFKPSCQYYNDGFLTGGYNRIMASMIDADGVRRIDYTDYVPSPSTSLTYSAPFFDLEPNSSWDNLQHHWHHNLAYVKNKWHDVFFVKSGSTLRVYIKLDGIVLRDATFTYSDSSLMSSFVLSKIRLGYTTNGVWCGAFRDLSIFSKALATRELDDYVNRIGTYMQWLESSFMWTDSSGAKSWLDEYFSSYYLNILEDGVSITDKSIKNATKKAFESFATADYGDKFTMTKILKDSVNFAEAYIDNIMFMLRAYETIAFAEKNPKTVFTIPKEVFSVTDLGKKQILLPKHESLALSEWYAKTSAKVTKESVSFAELVPKQMIDILADAFGVVDNKQEKQVSKVNKEILTFADLPKNAFTMPKFEVISVSDTGGRTVGLLKKESFGIVETKLPKSMTRVNKEYLNIAELYSDIIGYILRVYEAVSLTERHPKSVNTPKYDSFGISEVKQPKTIGAVRSEAVNVADKSIKTATHIEKEAISYVDTVLKLPSILKKESLATTDKAIKSPTKKSLETVAFSEVYKDTIAFNRIFSETVTLLDRLVKNYGMKKYEAIQLVDDIIRNANAVLSDLVFTDAAITLDEFVARTSSPEGYEQFKDFIPGDHNYQKALIRTVVETYATGGRPYLNKWMLNVDVPDVKDSGSTSISAVTTKVYFNRTFIEPPEVQITLRGGTRGLPCIINITPEYFEVELVNPTTNELIAGSLSWSATGY